MNQTVRIPATEMFGTFKQILLRQGFTPGRAKECAGIFTASSLDGVYTHGVNRFARFIEYIRQGIVKANARPRKIHASAAIEQWNGNLGPGPLNAVFATKRVMQNARIYGIACLAMANTNHWMRAGTYGWLAAKKGFVFIAWTNTMANMSAWGAQDSRLGNNPLVLAVPYAREAIVLDMAMSQFSFGTMELKKMQGEKLSVPGGFDKKGHLTDNPRDILASGASLAMGYWKGAGLSLLLDILAAILSAGIPVKEISLNKYEQALSQVFIAIDITQLKNYPAIGHTINMIIDDYLKSIPGSTTAKIVYPGQRALKTREENSARGIPVNAEVWNIIRSL